MKHYDHWSAHADYLALTAMYGGGFRGVHSPAA